MASPLHLPQLLQPPPVGLSRRAAAAVLLTGAAPTLGAASALPMLRIPGPNDGNDTRFAFAHALLSQALEAAGHPVSLQRLTGLGQRRMLTELGDGHVDVAVLPSMASVPPGVTSIRWPIRRGLLGLRLLLSRPEMAQRLSQVSSVSELQRFKLGYGSGWLDVDRMRQLGFQLETSGNYTGLFQMLRAGRFDFLHRGVNEIWGEVDNPALAGTGLVVVPRIALFYPLDDYFHVAEPAAEWAPRIERGLQLLWSSGRYATLFREWFGPALARAELPKRRVLHVLGYGVDPGTPIEAFDAWRLPR